VRSFATGAAKAFGVGEPRLVKFDPKLAKADLRAGEKSPKSSSKRASRAAKSS
jgi:hypothetical protein